MPFCAAQGFCPGLQRASVKLRPGLGMHCGFSERTDFSTAAPHSHLQALYDAAKQTFRQGRDISTAEIDTVSQLLGGFLSEARLWSHHLCGQPNITLYLVAAAVPLEEIGLNDQAVAATQASKCCLTELR